MPVSYPHGHLPLTYFSLSMAGNSEPSCSAEKECTIAPMRPTASPRRLVAGSLRLSLTQSAGFWTSSRAHVAEETMASTSQFTSKPNRFHQSLSSESGLSAKVRFILPHQNLSSCSSLNAAHLKKRSISASPFARFIASTQRHRADCDNETNVCYLTRSALSRIDPHQASQHRDFSRHCQGKPWLQKAHSALKFVRAGSRSPMESALAISLGTSRNREVSPWRRADESCTSYLQWH